MFKSKGKRWSQGAECGGKGNRMYQAGWIMKGAMNETEELGQLASLSWGEVMGTSWHWNRFPGPWSF